MYRNCANKSSNKFHYIHKLAKEVLYLCHLCYAHFLFSFDGRDHIAFHHLIIGRKIIDRKLYMLRPGGSFASGNQNVSGENV